jgi:hypothetical protein
VDVADAHVLLLDEPFNGLKAIGLNGSYQEILTEDMNQSFGRQVRVLCIHKVCILPPSFQHSLEVLLVVLNTGIGESFAQAFRMRQ